MSERTLVYRVTVAGQAQFASALKGITDLVKKNGAEQLAIDETVAKRRRAMKDGSAKHEASLLKTQIALEKARYRQLLSDASKAERAIQTDKNKAEREKTRSVERETKARERIARDSARASLRQHESELRAFERSEKQKTAIADRESRARARQAQRILDREDRDRMFDRKRFYRGVGTGFVEGGAGAARAVYGVASRGVRSIAQATGFNSAFDIADIAQEQLSVGSTLRSVSIEARLAGRNMDFNEGDAAKKIRFAALKYGLKQSDLAGAINAYSEKGSGATAVKNIDRIAGQATALGTSAETIAKLRAQMGLSSSVTGKELSEDEKDDLVAKMHFIGKTGVFRAEDMAQESELRIPDDLITESSHT